MSEINSKAYWDLGFRADWDSCGGPAQSRFFATLATENMPQWLWAAIRRENLVLADWGCAEGDGTALLTRSCHLPRVIGVDWSATAISTAAHRYPTIHFVAEDWLLNHHDNIPAYDVLFSSNTLEHFRRPFDVLDRISARAGKVVALVLPYRESNRIDEHFSSFFPIDIPISLRNGFRLVWSRVIDCRKIDHTYWNGDQIFLVYAEPIWLDSLRLRLVDCSISFHSWEPNATLLAARVVERDEQISTLTNSIAQMKHSLSWRITAPLRAAQNLFISPKRTLYSIARSLFRTLPASVRQRFHPHRHKVVRWVRRILTPQGQLNTSRQSRDLSWTQFQAIVLSQRDSYKGVFVQETAIDWNGPLHQRPQHLAAAFGRLGYLVIYRTDNWIRDDVDGFREATKNVWLTNRYEVPTLQAVVHSVYSTSYAMTPELLSQRGSPGPLVYQYIDQIDPEISGDQENINRLLRLKDFAFDGGADFIVASAKHLYDEAVAVVGKDKVLLVPNGVDAAHYRNPIHKATVLPDSLIGFKAKHKTVVGYFGALAPWLWYEVIAELAAQRPDLGFVFIGPDYYGDSDRLSKLQNVLRLGMVDYKILPAYANEFDICCIPFKPGNIAKTTSPLKLFEYFALEKPVVVTAGMDECTAYSEVFSGDSAPSLSSAIDTAIKVKDDVSFKRRLAQLADENDWLQRARAMEICFRAVK